MDRKMKSVLFILLGIAIAAFFFFWGDDADAPGLTLIGSVVGFLVCMRGLYHANILKKGYPMVIILSVLGMLAILFPFVLLGNGEIARYSLGAFMVNLLGASSVAYALVRMKKTADGQF